MASSVDDRLKGVYKQLNEDNIGDDIERVVQKFIDFFRSKKRGDQDFVPADRLEDYASDFRRYITEEREGEMSEGRRALRYDGIGDQAERVPAGMRPATYGAEDSVGDTGTKEQPRTSSFMDNPESAVETAGQEKSNPASYVLQFVSGEPNMGGNEEYGDPALGQYITTVQNSLMAKGYDLPKFGADGWYGSETESAVRKFQKDNGLKVDGIVGNETKEALFNE